MTDNPVVKLYEFEHGLTVKEFKAIVKDWPEIDTTVDKDPTLVWIETAWCTTNVVSMVIPLSGEQLELCSRVTEEPTLHDSQAVQLLRKMAEIDPWRENHYATDICVFCDFSESDGHHAECPYVKAKAFLAALDVK